VEFVIKHFALAETSGECACHAGNKFSALSGERQGDEKASLARSSSLYLSHITKLAELEA
jgi:hypothetical protein